MLLLAKIVEIQFPIVLSIIYFITSQKIEYHHVHSPKEMFYFGYSTYFLCGNIVVILSIGKTGNTDYLSIRKCRYFNDSLACAKCEMNDILNGDYVIPVINSDDSDIDRRFHEKYRNFLFDKIDENINNYRICKCRISSGEYRILTTINTPNQEIIIPLSKIFKFFRIFEENKEGSMINRFVVLFQKAFQQKECAVSYLDKLKHIYIFDLVKYMGNFPVKVNLIHVKKNNIGDPDGRFLGENSFCLEHNERYHIVKFLIGYIIEPKIDEKSLTKFVINNSHAKNQKIISQIESFKLIVKVLIGLKT